MKIYTFELRGQIAIRTDVEATTLHTALYKLGKRLEKMEKFRVGDYNYAIVLKQIETKVVETKIERKPELNG